MVDIDIFDEIDSTNDEAKRINLKNDFHLIVAEKQTKGRGRQGKKWSSPDSGNILLGDDKLNTESISKRTTLGLSYLPQESSIFRGLTVEHNILSSLEQRKDLNPKERINCLASLLDEFNLSEFSSTQGIKLSGGERRRTEIARSLASNPKFMLLDEPFAGIDPLAVADLKNTIIKLNEKKIGVLISDHNVRDTMNICSKVIVVNKGKIIANGKPDEIAKDSLVKEVYLGQNFLN